MTSRFEADTMGTVLHPDWSIGDKPNGGYLMAVAARQLWNSTRAAGSPHPHPVSVTTHFLRPAENTTFEHSAEVLRVGRTFSTAQGGLLQDGKVRVHTIATFGDVTGPGASQEFSAPPSLPDPSECVLRDDSIGPEGTTPLAEVIETRMHPDSGWLKGKPTGIPKVVGWTRFRDGHAPDPWSLLFFADALAPTVFEWLPERSWVPTIEMTVHIRSLPVSGWLRASFTTNHVSHGRFEEDGELWDEAGTLVAQSRQLAMIFQ